MVILIKPHIWGGSPEAETNDLKSLQDRFESDAPYQYPHLPKRLWGRSYKSVAGCSTQPVWTSPLVQQGFWILDDADDKARV